MQTIESSIPDFDVKSQLYLNFLDDFRNKLGKSARFTKECLESLLTKLWNCITGALPTYGTYELCKRLLSMHHIASITGGGLVGTSWYAIHQLVEHFREQTPSDGGQLFLMVLEGLLDFAAYVVIIHMNLNGSMQAEALLSNIKKFILKALPDLFYYSFKFRAVVGQVVSITSKAVRAATKKLHKLLKQITQKGKEVYTDLVQKNNGTNLLLVFILAMTVISVASIFMAAYTVTATMVFVAGVTVVSTVAIAPWLPFIGAPSIGAAAYGSAVNAATAVMARKWWRG